MTKNIIDLTKKVKRESFNQLRESGTDFLITLADLFSIPFGSMMSGAYKGITSIKDFLFIKKLGSFLETEGRFIISLTRI